MFAWNSSVQASNEAPKSPGSSGGRVKTPPTVEMIDPQSEGEESGEAKNNQEVEPGEQLKEVKEKLDESEAEEKTESPKSEDIPAAPTTELYENVLLVDVRLRDITCYEIASMMIHFLALYKLPAC